MNNTLTNFELQAEYFASLYLKGNIVSQPQVQIAMDFAQIPLTSVGNSFDDLLLQLQSKVSDSFGLIRSSVMDAFLQGKEKDLLSLVTKLFQSSNELLPLMNKGVQLTEMQNVSDVEALMSDSQDILDMQNKLGQVSRKNENLEQIRINMVDLLKLNTYLEEILDLYGSQPQKFPSMRDLTGKKQYQDYLIDLQNNMDELVTDPLVSMKLGIAIQSLGQVRPLDNLDPYKEQVFENLIELLANPKDFYKDCKIEKIVGQMPGTLFSTTYPQFTEKFMSMYLEDYETMDFSEQINFRNCFGIPADNSELLQLTNNYIKMSYTT